MSEDNEKKTDNNDFADLGFDPFQDSSVAPKDAPAFEGTPVSLDKTSEEEPVPSSFLTGDETPPADVPVAAVDAAADGGKGKKGKKKKEKAAKPKKEKEESDKTKEPIGAGGVFALVSGLLLLVILLAFDALMFVKPSLILGETGSVGSSSVLYYVIGITVIGLAGVVAVPFMLFANRKETDIFKVALGISVMALSTGAILLLTEWCRYDFAVKP
ncbi:MAG: hypothetical protein LBN39_08825 [Planctomycetaceae bacterium]|jgi:hypothetical protein|nr:hypothetical protein [Planctomycetaceae bacterium]